MMTPLESPRVQALIALSAAAFAAVILRVFPPSMYSFYPRCPIHEWFGVLCPGCGGTHALAALAVGDWREAWRDNALVTLSAVFAVFPLCFAVRWNRWPAFLAAPRVSPLAIRWALTAAMLFAAARNLDAHVARMLR